MVDAAMQTAAMKALTLWQPWASLIAHGVKTIETRSWAPPLSLVGQRIAIHAAARRVDSKDRLWNRLAADALSLDSYYVSAETSMRNNLPRGQVLCTARLTGAWQVAFHDPCGGEDGVPYAMCDDARGGVPTDPWGDFSVGRWLWFLDDIHVFDEPIPARGGQRIWNWTSAPAETTSDA